jgi:hypothetical protein
VWGEIAAAIPFPIKIWSSDNDYIASNTTVCQAWSASVASAGGNITPVVESLGAVGHTDATLPAAEVVAWFDANGGRS